MRLAAFILRFAVSASVIEIRPLPKRESLVQIDWIALTSKNGSLSARTAC